MHNRLRAAGANKTTAAAWPRRSIKFYSEPAGIDRIEGLIEKYQNYALIISREKKLPIEYVLNGMMDSGMDESELDRYVDTVYF